MFLPFQSFFVCIFFLYFKKMQLFFTCVFFFWRNTFSHASFTFASAPVIAGVPGSYPRTPAFPILKMFHLVIQLPTFISNLFGLFCYDLIWNNILCFLNASVSSIIVPQFVWYKTNHLVHFFSKMRTELPKPNIVSRCHLPSSSTEHMIWPNRYKMSFLKIVSNLIFHETQC